MNTENTAIAAATPAEPEVLSKADYDPRPLLLVVRGILCLTLFLALFFLFKEGFSITNLLPFASSLESAKRVVSFPSNLELYGELFGFLALHLLLLSAAGQFLHTGEEFFRSKIGEETEINSWTHRAINSFLWSGIAASASALYVLTQMSRGSWPMWAVWLFRIAWAVKWISLIIAGCFLIVLWRRGMEKKPVWLIKDQIREALQMAFFLRVPLISAFLLGLIAPVALGPARPFLEATLFYEPNLVGLWQFFLTAFAAYLVAVASASQIAIILERGPERFNAHDYGHTGCRALRFTFQHSALIAASLLMGSVSVYSAATNWGENWWVCLLVPAWALGGGLALFVVFCADWLRNHFTDPMEPERIAGSFLILPRDGFLTNLWNNALDNAKGHTPGRLSRESKFLNVVPNLIRFFHPVGFGKEEGKGAAYADIASAIWILILSGVLFTITVMISVPNSNSMNTLGSILLLLLFLGWLMSSLTFIFDRFHIPVLAAALAVRVIFGFLPDTDHWFKTEGVAARTAITPREMLLSHPNPILIAASGGGIQASAWLTTVMQTLNQKTNGNFRDRVALISGVSGGSVGAFLLGSHWNDNWEIAQGKARITSLGRVAWATVGLDLFRPIVSGTSFGDWDRGYALEHDIDRRAGSYVPGGNMLAHWTAAAGKNFPVFLFNATVVETGGPVAFATGEFPSDNFVRNHPNSPSPGHVSLSQRRFFANYCPAYSVQDLRVATAARLSATFPYVSPAARPKGDAAVCNYHFVDGGYYDNYGLVSLLQWLDDGLEDMTDAERNNLGIITILVIRGKVPESPVSYENGVMIHNVNSEMPKKVWNFGDQSTAPLSAFLAMRTYAQWQGGSAAVRIIREKWANKARINPIAIAYDDPKADDENALCAEEPLTWKLTPPQQRCIDYQAGRINVDASSFNRAPVPQTSAR